MLEIFPEPVKEEASLYLYEMEVRENQQIEEDLAFEQGIDYDQEICRLNGITKAANSA